MKLMRSKDSPPNRGSIFWSTLGTRTPFDGAIESFKIEIVESILT